MALTEPLDLYDILVVKLAGQDQFLEIFLFLCLILISIMAARFRMTAMSLFIAMAIFSFIMSNALNNAGSFVIITVLSIVGLVLAGIIALRRPFE